MNFPNMVVGWAGGYGPNSKPGNQKDDRFSFLCSPNVNGHMVTLLFCAGCWWFHVCTWRHVIGTFVCNLCSIIQGRQARRGPGWWSNLSWFSLSLSTLGSMWAVWCLILIDDEVEEHRRAFLKLIGRCANVLTSSDFEYSYSIYDKTSRVPNNKWFE